MIYICVIGINRLQFCFSVTILVSLYILSKQIVTLLSASFFFFFSFFRWSWSDKKGKIHMSIEFFIMTWFSSKHRDYKIELFLSFSKIDIHLIVSDISTFFRYVWYYQEWVWYIRIFIKKKKNCLDNKQSHSCIQ